MGNNISWWYKYRKFVEGSINSDVLGNIFFSGRQMKKRFRYRNRGREAKNVSEFSE